MTWPDVVAKMFQTGATLTLHLTPLFVWLVLTGISFFYLVPMNGTGIAFIIMFVTGIILGAAQIDLYMRAYTHLQEIWGLTPPT